jgi:hypothetical protein
MRCTRLCSLKPGVTPARETRDDGLIFRKVGGSLTILPHEGVSGFLSRTIANERSRSDPVGERVDTGMGAHKPVGQAGQRPRVNGADRPGPAVGAGLRGRSERSDLWRMVGIRLALIRSESSDLKRMPRIQRPAWARSLARQRWRRSHPRRRPAGDEGASALGPAWTSVRA